MNVSGIPGAWNPLDSMHGMSGASSVPPSPDPALSDMRSAIKQRTQDFKDLRNALRTGDLSSAQNAFTSLQTEIQKASEKAGGKSPFDPASPIGKDFQSLADALKAQDLKGAQSAFATLRQDMRAARHHAPPPGSAPPSAGTPPGLDALA